MCDYYLIRKLTEKRSPLFFAASNFNWWVLKNSEFYYVQQLHCYGVITMLLRRYYGVSSSERHLVLPLFVSVTIGALTEQKENTQVHKVCVCVGRGGGNAFTIPTFNPGLLVWVSLTTRLFSVSMCQSHLLQMCLSFGQDGDDEGGGLIGVEGRWNDDVIARFQGR